MFFVIPGEPKAKQRPRHGKGFTYTPKETVLYENWVRSCYTEEAKGFFYEGDKELCVNIYVYFGIPKSTSKKKAQEMLYCRIRPIKKPDCDNIAKSILDSLNGIAYKDDSQVVTLIVKKFYGEIPRVEVDIEEV